jgi:hypothetical protein
MLYTIAFTIIGRPFVPGEKFEGVTLKISLACVALLTDCVSAALAGNLVEPPVVAMTQSGFIGYARVKNLSDGLLTIRNLIDRIGLTETCAIAGKGPIDSSFQHWSGPAIGSFESQFAEAEKWRQTVKTIIGKPPPSQPEPPSQP